MIRPLCRSRVASPSASIRYAFATTALCWNSAHVNSFSPSRNCLQPRAYSSIATPASTLTTDIIGGSTAASRNRISPGPSHIRIQRYSTSLTMVPNENEQQLTKDALQICKDAIQAVNPYSAIQSHFEVADDVLSINDEAFELQRYDNIVLVAFGKASSAMAASVIQQLESGSPKSVTKLSGIVICKDDHATPNEVEALSHNNIETRYASHPVPDERSANAAAAVLDLVSSTASDKTLVLCCISGGGSSLFCQPRKPLTLKDLQATNSALLASGLDIQDMNVIRKRLEEGKGGRLAAAAYPSKLVGLVLSDVLGDPLDLIASGPTVPDTSSWHTAWDLVEQHKLETKLPDNIVAILRDGKSGNLPDSPPPDHPAFETTSTVLVGNNEMAVMAAANTAKQLGYHPVVLGSQFEGEAKEIANVYVAMALYLQQQAEKQSGSDDTASLFSLRPSLPVALIAGGETTVALPANPGMGGRNQELALAAALKMHSLEMRDVVLTSIGTDGTDGPTDAAGAVVDGTTVSEDLKDAQLALSDHNAYPYLATSKAEGMAVPLIKTGPTGTNVADICVTLITSKK